MPRKKTFWLIGIMAIVMPLQAIMVANPADETPFERFGTSLEVDFEKWKLRYNVGPDYEVTSQRGLIKPSLGIFRYVEGYGLIGFADLNIPSGSRAISDFNGSKEMAFGLGVKTHFAVYYPDLSCKNDYSHPIKLCADATWLTTKSLAVVDYATGLLRYEDSYRFQQFDLNLYGSWELGRTVPYLGVKWVYMVGRKYRRAYQTGSETPFQVISGYFNYPGEIPKPVIGLDIGLGKGYYLSFEATYMGKSETSIGIGLSQLYVPNREEDTPEQTIEKPED